MNYQGNVGAPWGNTSYGIALYDTNIPGQVLGPETINDFSTMAIPAYWRAINFLASNLATFPRAVYLNKKKLEVAHRLDQQLQRRPNQLQASIAFWRALFFHATHLHNGFAKIVRKSPTSTDVAALYNLYPHDVAPFRWYPEAKEGEIPNDITKAQQFYAVLSTKEILPAADVIHLTGLSYDGMAGINPMFVHRSTFERGRMLDRYATRFLQKGTVVRGSIEIPYEASEEQVQKILDRIATYHVGPNAERDVIMLTNGAKLNNATLTPRDSQLIEQQKYTTTQISQLTGVPPQFLYEFSDSKYNNAISEMGEDVVRYTFRPWIELIEDELTTKLLPEKEVIAGYGVRLDPNALLRGSAQAQSTMAIAEVGGGIRTRNEGRDVLGLPADPDPESDKLKQLGDTSPPKPAATPPANYGRTPGEIFGTLKPLLDDACARVEAKTAKAFERKDEKAPADRIIWANVFSGEQEKFAREALAPVADVLQKLEGRTLDITKVAQRYAGAIRKRAADGSVMTLTAILEGEINGTDHL